MKKNYINRIFDLPHALCLWLIGEEHHIAHRMVAGFCIMAVGVGVAKSAHAAPHIIVQGGLDLMGYFIHGLGAVPFIEWFIHRADAPEDHNFPPIEDEEEL